MCTVSWLASDRGYDLLFNRDELNRRAPEHAPAVGELAGVTFIAPRDGDHGGTWLLVNEYGLTVCLLNDYENQWSPAVAAEDMLSRGGVVLAAAAVHQLDALPQRISALPLVRVMPFRLIATAPGEGPIMLHWDGTTLHERSGPDVTAPLSSSSFRPEEVIASRRSRYPQAGDRVAIDDLLSYHRQHDNDAGAFSVLMQRPDAATRSLIRVTVSEADVALEYCPVTRGAAEPSVGEPLTLRINRRS
jgi:hypothetical protein